MTFELTGFILLKIFNLFYSIPKKDFQMYYLLVKIIPNAIKNRLSQLTAQGWEGKTLLKKVKQCKKSKQIIICITDNQTNTRN